MPSLQSLFSTNAGITDAELTTYSHTTASLADDASSIYDFTIAKSALIKKVTSSVPSRLRLYSSAAARTADSRDGNTTTNPPEGLLIDVEFTTTPDTVLFTPLEVIGNQESPLNSTIYAKIFNLSGGASTVAVTIEAYSLSQQINSANQREVLTADRTYYVRTDGNDNNDGLSDTAGGAFLTIQKGIDVVAMLDRSIYNVIIQVAAGTYANFTCKEGIGSGTITIQGNELNPTSVIVIGVISSGSTEFYKLRYFRLEALIVSGNATTFSINNVDFKSTTEQTHIRVLNKALLTIGDYTISGGSAGYHWFVYGNGAISGAACDIVVSNNPSFTTFLQMIQNATFNGYAMTFTGSATGKRYNIKSNSVFDSSTTVSTTAMPGNVIGTTETGGQYV